MTTDELVEQEKMKDEALQMVISNVENRITNLIKLIEGVNYSESKEYQDRKQNIISYLNTIKTDIISLFIQK